jgi:hypothetical protein
MKKLNKILIVLVAVTIIMEGLSYAQDGFDGGRTKASN